MEIKGKVVLITGASYGIGKATAELFSRQGAKVALAARSLDKLKAMAATMPDSFVIPVDMTKPEQARKMVNDTAAHYGRLDVLINNAGRGMHTPIEFADPEDYACLMSLNVYGPLIAMQATIPLMRKQGGGSIVNISSGLTRMALPGVGPYASTKSALNMLSLAARKELEKDNIVVSLVLPGVTDTDFRKNSFPSKVPFARPSGSMPPADPPELVAAKILEAVATGAAEVVLESVKSP